MKPRLPIASFVAAKTIEQIAELIEVHRIWENNLHIHVHYAQGRHRTVLEGFFDGEESICVGERHPDGGIIVDPYCSPWIGDLQPAYCVRPDPAADEQLKLVVARAIHWRWGAGDISIPGTIKQLDGKLRRDLRRPGRVREAFLRTTEIERDGRGEFPYVWYYRLNDGTWTDVQCLTMAGAIQLRRSTIIDLANTPVMTNGQLFKP